MTTTDSTETLKTEWAAIAGIIATVSVFAIAQGLAPGLPITLGLMCLALAVLSAARVRAP